MLPGSHCYGDAYTMLLQDAAKGTGGFLAADGAAAPAIALETRPGDLVVFNHMLKHGSFFGSGKRRMFVINCCEHVTVREVRVGPLWVRLWKDGM